MFGRAELVNIEDISQIEPFSDSIQADWSSSLCSLPPVPLS